MKDEPEQLAFNSFHINNLLNINSLKLNSSTSSMVGKQVKFSKGKPSSKQQPKVRHSFLKKGSSLSRQELRPNRHSKKLDL